MSEWCEKAGRAARLEGPPPLANREHARPVWMVTGSFHPLVGGAEVQVYLVTKLLLTRGWRIHVITRRHGRAVLRGALGREVHDGIPIRRVPNLLSSKLGSLIYLLAGFWGLLIEGRGSIYHAHHEGAPAFLAIVARYLLRGRCVLTFHSGADVYRRLSTSYVRRRQLKLLFRVVDRLVAVNEDVAHVLHDCGAPQSKVALIRNGVDTAYFRPPSAIEKSEARVRLNIDATKTVAVYVGRLEPVKGADVLVAAWKRLPSKILSQLLLVIVGDGSERWRLSEMIREGALQQSVRLVGMQSRVRDYYWAADLLVLPSRSEGLPVSLIEGMACSLPVLVTDLPGCREIVTNGINGATCRPDDSESLRTALISLINDRERWPDLGTRGRAMAMARASLSETTERLNLLYTQLESELGG